MDKFQVNDLKEILNKMMPNTYSKNYGKDDRQMWQLTVDSVMSIMSYKSFAETSQDEGEKEMFLGFIKIRRDRIARNIGQQLFDALMREAERFQNQCKELHPNKDVADTETIEKTVTVDRDGFEFPEKHYTTVYHLKSPWRQFKAGETITYINPARGIGGWCSGRWEKVQFI